MNLTCFSNSLRKANAILYDGVCRIAAFERVAGTVDGFQEVLVGEDIPCRLDFDASPTAAVKENGLSAVSLSAVLFLSPTVAVSAGCRVEVAQQGKTWLFEAAGTPVVYAGHQEVALKGVSRWA